MQFARQVQLRYSTPTERSLKAEWMLKGREMDLTGSTTIVMVMSMKVNGTVVAEVEEAS